MGGGGVAWTSKSPKSPHDPVDSNLHPACIQKVEMGKMGGGGVAWTSKSPLSPHDPVDSNLHPTCIQTELGLLQSISLTLI